MALFSTRRKSRWPQFRIVGLLALMAMVAVASSAIGVGAAEALVWTLLYFFPTVVGSLLALFQWPSPRMATRVFNAIMGGVFLLLALATVLTMGLALVLALSCLLFWMPQYALALTYFETFRDTELSPDEPLPADWAAKLAEQLEEEK
jgi:peptidoglycan/LPS O-acetylase OafA/YrhL